jgi:hypothetical protein
MPSACPRSKEKRCKREYRLPLVGGFAEAPAAEVLAMEPEEVFDPACTYRKSHATSQTNDRQNEISSNPEVRKRRERMRLR